VAHVRRRRERLDKEAKDIRSVIEMRTTELKARTAQLETATSKMDALGESLKAQRTKTDKSVRH
jgi:flagellar capping protein FliD